MMVLYCTIQALLSEIDPLRRPLRYRNHIGLDIVTLPNARWDFNQGVCGQGRLVPAAALALGPIRVKSGAFSHLMTRFEASERP